MENLTTGQRIAECRKEKGLSQEALGEKMGVSRQAISKWEADAAMPDVDKLIALSRLFSVSVGWLLGVEEKPEPQPEATQVSEALLHKIEDVVQQYQPKKKRSPWRIGAVIAVVLLLLWGGLWLGDQWKALRGQVDYLSGQINRNSNSAILSQLNSLENRIDSINDTIEQGAAVLAEYEFQINPDPAAGTAYVHMHAVPKTWKEDWSAALSVRYEGLQTMSQTCAWDGSALVSGLKLNLQDGYEFWLVITYPGGSMEQVRLQDEIAGNLKSATTITCEVSGQGLPLRYTGGQHLPLNSYDLHLAQPKAMAPSTWVRAEYVLYHIRDDVQTVADRNDMSPMDDAISITQEFWAASQTDMQFPELQNNDRLELWFEAELENGISCAVKVDSWVYRAGEFMWEN